MCCNSNRHCCVKSRTRITRVIKDRTTIIGCSSHLQWKNNTTHHRDGRSRNQTSFLLLVAYNSSGDCCARPYRSCYHIHYAEWAYWLQDCPRPMQDVPLSFPDWQTHVRCPDWPHKKHHLRSGQFAAKELAGGTCHRWLGSCKPCNQCCYLLYFCWHCCVSVSGCFPLVLVNFTGCPLVVYLRVLVGIACSSNHFSTWRNTNRGSPGVAISP